MSVALIGALVGSAQSLGRHLFVVAALTAVNAAGQLSSHRLRARSGRAFDLSLAVMLCAAVVAGPAAAFAVVALPELAYLGRRGRAFLNLGFVANVVSYAGIALVAGEILTGVAVLRIAVAAIAMLLVSYLLARLLLLTIRDGADPRALIRGEFVPVVPQQAFTVAVGVLSAVALPIVGLGALLALAGLVYVPQLVAVRLAQAPSVAQLDVDAAAAVYRAALADELGCARRDRRLIEQVAALAAGRRDQLGEVPNPMAIMSDALEVQICLGTTRTQRDYYASDRAQVVLCAQRWAELTARCTPALSHGEAIVELQRAPVAGDAPQAVAAASAIVAREQAFTEHIAGVPRLHRVPGPRVLRRRLVPAALVRVL